MKLFLDTTILISAVTTRKPSARRILDSQHELVTNEYALKEVRRALSKYYAFPPKEVNDSIDEIRVRVRVLATPSKLRVKTIQIRDKSDSQIVLGAIDAGAILVIDDQKTYDDGKKYVKTMKSSEVE